MSLEQLLAVIPAGSPDEDLARQVNFDQLPAHVAIIMDGNGRWAAKRHLPRVEGHRAGIDSVRDVIETSARLGIEVLTLYAFSVENWKRPKAEVGTLMLLLKRYIRSELSTLTRNNIRFRVVGRPDALAVDVQDELNHAIERMIDRFPSQYMWGYKRFKGVPGFPVIYNAEPSIAVAVRQRYPKLSNHDIINSFT